MDICVHVPVHPSLQILPCWIAKALGRPRSGLDAGVLQCLGCLGCPYVDVCCGSICLCALDLCAPMNTHTIIPICSMYSIFSYIWVIFRANVGKYSIHGAYGIYSFVYQLCDVTWCNREGEINLYGIHWMHALFFFIGAVLAGTKFLVEIGSSMPHAQLVTVTWSVSCGVANVWCTLRYSKMAMEIPHS